MTSAAIRLFAALFLVKVVGAQIIKERTVNCQSRAMEVTFDFAQPFTGIVYADKHYQTSGCQWTGDGSRRLVIPVSLNVHADAAPFCGVKIHDATGEFSVMLIVSPIAGLLVDGMQSLTVKCIYSIGDVTLTLPAGPNGAGIFISPQTQAGIVTGSGGAPFLQMAIRDSHGIGGELIQSASVGQQITLDVVMEKTDIYDFYVHDCYAHDGTNSPDARISIIDQEGCAVGLSRAVAVPTFTTTPIDGGSKHVYVHMYGFQFTTSQLVYFECQVRPCLRQCDRQQCEATSLVKRSVGAARLKRQQPSEVENYRLQAVLQIQPHQQLIVPAARDQPLVDTAGGGVCVNRLAAIVLFAIFLLTLVVSVAVAAFVCCRSPRAAKADGWWPRVRYFTPVSTPSRPLSSTASSLARPPPSSRRHAESP